jgi:5,10-methylenetetrahydromethanopterin reductase
MASSASGHGTSAPAGDFPMSRRVAMYLQDAHALKDGIGYCQYAEEKGFEAVWQAESRLVRDAIVPMAAFAATTSRLKVGSGVINNWTRNAALIAATFLTLDDLAPDRILLGLGAWWDPLAQNVGIDRRRPLVAMREVVTVVRRLLNMERVTFHGDFVHVTDIELDIVHGRREPRNVPIYIGATGMKMMELTGEIADGALLNYLVSPQYNHEAMDALDRGAKRAGRRAEDLDRPQLIVCSVDHDRKRGIDGARRLVTQYLGQQPHIMKASGVSGELLDRIHQVLTWPATEEQIERAMALVPDDVVQLITASGTPEECARKVDEYIAAGCTCPVLYPLGDVRLMIDAFAN